jgi:hypothetical protein
MNNKFPDGPFFIPSYTSPQGGVDFLGLRQVNLDFMSSCLPGINNVTRYIRPFSVISWMYWKIYDIMNQNKIDIIKNVEINNFCEKVETLFTWGHIINNTGGIPGLDSKPPKSIKGKVPLLFSDWKRTKKNTSLMAAVQYGPASKTNSGLSFVRPMENNIFKTCSEGVNLAVALDQKLKKTSAYSIINNLNTIEGTVNDASELYSSWSIEKPTKEEKAAFLKNFFDKNSIGDNSLIGHRSATIELLQEVLRNNKKVLEIQALRIKMAYLLNSKGDFIELKEQLKFAQKRWLILQIRQSQRLALEGLFAWVENVVLKYSINDFDQISNRAVESLMSDPFFYKCEKVSDIIKNQFRNFKSIEDLICASQTNDDLCIFELMYNLEVSLKDYSDMIASLAFKNILLCYFYCELLKPEKNIYDLLTHGGSGRISLAYLNQTINNINSMTIKGFINFILEYFVLSQHFAVASGRYDGNTQRLRLAIEDDGFRCLNEKPWKPNITSDRLYAAISLLNDCDVIRLDRDKGIVELL